jgi:formylglycine-generating enzyme required for sulfatase activity
MNKLTLLFLVFQLFSNSLSAQEKFKVKELEKSLVLIPAGSFHYGQSDQDIPYQHVTRSRVMEVDSFYMFNHEVTNGEYQIFIEDVKSKDTAYYKQMLPDTLVWRDRYSYSEPMVDYYFRHPAYRNCPVLGISYEQAESYCKWLTAKYMNEEKRKFKHVEFQLPTIAEWTYAAKGRLDLSKFPWKGNSMQDKDGKWMAKFRVIPQDGIGYEIIPVQKLDGGIEMKKILTASGWNGAIDFDHWIVAPVKSYPANGYGLFDMAGNVEEYVFERGITKGGSWKDTGYYLNIQVEELYDSTSLTSSERGFRFVMKLNR